MAKAKTSSTTATTGVPLPPSDFFITGIAGTQVSFKWSNVFPVVRSTRNTYNKYVLQRSTSDTFASIQSSVNINEKATTYTDTAPSQGATYYYRLCASNTSGSSKWIQKTAVIPTVVAVAPGALSVLDGMNRLATDRNLSGTPFLGASGRAIFWDEARMFATSPAWSTLTPAQKQVASPDAVRIASAFAALSDVEAAKLYVLDLEAWFATDFFAVNYLAVRAKCDIIAAAIRSGRSGKTPVRFAFYNGTPQRLWVPSANWPVRNNAFTSLDRDGSCANLYVLYEPGVKNTFSYQTVKDQWVAYAKSNISEARRMANGGPVRALVWFQYNSGNYLPDDFVQLIYDTLKALGVDDIIVWGGYGPTVIGVTKGWYGKTQLAVAA